jgi:hypothetical protein
MMEGYYDDSWQEASSQDGVPTLSQEIPLLSERGASQVLPPALQAGLEMQHDVIISSGLGTDSPIEIEQQVDVVTMEPLDLESEPHPIEAEAENDLGEQIPDEEVAVGAMEVTVWSTEVEYQEAPPTETEDMINQSSSSPPPDNADEVNAVSGAGSDPSGGKDAMAHPSGGGNTSLGKQGKWRAPSFQCCSPAGTYHDLAVRSSSDYVRHRSKPRQEPCLRHQSLVSVDIAPEQVVS